MCARLAERVLQGTLPPLAAQPRQGEGWGKGQARHTGTERGTKRAQNSSDVGGGQRGATHSLVPLFHNKEELFQAVPVDELLGKGDVSGEVRQLLQGVCLHVQVVTPDPAVQPLCLLILPARKASDQRHPTA